jgi:hypothetical protein
MTSFQLRTVVLLPLTALFFREAAWGTQAAGSNRSRVLQNVSEALAVSSSGRFALARQTLEYSLAGCPAGPSGRECRLLYASGLGSLLYRQAALDRQNRDSLYLGSVAYYDRLLTEAPDNSEAIYGKALSYRALGPHEWMEPFFRNAPKADPGRRGLYLTFLGDYYAAEGRWPQAAEVYRQAVQQDADEDGARSGLIDALAALGGPATLELLQYGKDWEVRYPGSAADAYGAILTGSFRPGGQRDAIADSAVVGLVRTQARNRLTVGKTPPAVDTGWTPVREIRVFLQTAAPEAAPWWGQGAERQSALAQAALAGGRVGVTEGKYDVAERIWTEGVRLARRSSAVSLDLERELATLYFRQPALDPGRKKFDALEQEIFAGKFGALATGDLEAAQRYHTTLALIYVARGVWGGTYARNAGQQLTWALDKAEERRQRQQFYQPLPELRQLLAHGLDSLKSYGEAGRRYAAAAAAFLDTDDLDAADSAVQNGKRLAADVTGPARVLALRSDLAHSVETASRCSPGSIAAIVGPGNSDFFSRQRFKILADCSKVDPRFSRQYAIAAFRLVDSARVTLVGGSDVVRFERVMSTLLEPFGVAFQAAHLDPVPPSGGPSIQVSLPGETTPLWVAAALDDVIAARVVAELGAGVNPFPITVSSGVLSIPASAAALPGLLKRLQGVTGVREVRVRQG